MEYCEQLFWKELLEEEDFNKEIPPEDEADNPILLSEVKAAIKKLKPEKNPGCYGIGTELPQAGGEPLTKVLHGMWKMTWRQG